MGFQFQDSKYSDFSLQELYETKSPQLEKQQTCKCHLLQLDLSKVTFYFVCSVFWGGFLNTHSSKPGMAGRINTLTLGFSHLAANSLSSMIFLLNSKLLRSTQLCPVTPQVSMVMVFYLWSYGSRKPPYAKSHIHNSYSLLYLKIDCLLVSTSFWSSSLLRSFSSAFK